MTDLDEISWHAGYGPSPVVGPCPHECAHHAQSCIAHGSDELHRDLIQCDVPETCDGGCRAWTDGSTLATTDWLQVEFAERVLSGAGGES